jgi:hypothetical protein
VILKTFGEVPDDFDFAWKSRASQLLRTVLIARKKFVDHMLAIENTIRGLRPGKKIKPAGKTGSYPIPA